MAASKKRLDLLLVEKGLASSRQRARALIMAGKVLVASLRVDKPGTQVDKTTDIVVKGNEMPYVSRGGIKLEAALRETALSVSGLTCMDVGASTGGFTDCLLQHGAARVYAVDVGYGQLAWKLRQDPRVKAIERTNIRYMDASAVPEPVDLVTIDASFISLKNVVPPVLKFMTSQGRILALIKPQFEAGKGKVGKGGVVRDPEQRRTIIADLVRFFESIGLQCGPVTPSPVLGPKGNQEYVILLSRADFA
ncbi:MAG: TlyA family RNA methyltransferase [Desulfobacteraceae bacterium]|jgi:23S rRNA (cytidine1920-2'-O)/16S rRNA (cytidine1409-2'-O)-methyltransferase